MNLSKQELIKEIPREILRLPGSFLNGFVTVPRVRKALLKAGSRFTISDALHLNIYINRPNRARSWTKSEYERESLQKGLSAFIQATIISQRSGRSPSENLEWIVPEDSVTNEMRINRRTIEIINEHNLVADLGSEYQRWLPWLSLGMVNLFRRWRRPRISALHRALFKLFESEKFDYPWETDQLSIRSQLPLQVLYKFEPSTTVYEGLTILANLGLSSVNDLRCLHPDAIIASKTESQSIVRLYLALESKDT